MANWATIGNVLTVTKTGLSLTAGATYYFSVRAVNGAGLTGTATNSNGQYVETMNTADTTPPSSISQVRDGNDTGADAGVTYLTDELSANWTPSADAESGIARYYYAIGTTPVGTNVTNGWIDNGELTEVTQTGLTLTVGTTYYFSVKAENGVSLQSNSTNSNGQLVASQDSQGPVISIVSVQSITNAGATITWETDEPSTSRVEYGLSAGYGSLTGEYIVMNTAHSVTLAGLQAETQYHYRVISRDGSGNEGVSADYTFTTPAAPVAVAGITAYPNPCNFSNGQVVKFKVQSSKFGEVKIYTMSGKLVRKLTIENGATETTWDGKNEYGIKIARGIYIYTITETSGNKITGKIAIVR